MTQVSVGEVALINWSKARLIEDNSYDDFYVVSESEIIFISENAEKRYSK